VHETVQDDFPNKTETLKFLNNDDYSELVKYD
jgi:hypothetical protein